MEQKNPQAQSNGLKGDIQSPAPQAQGLGSKQFQQLPSQDHKFGRSPHSEESDAVIYVGNLERSIQEEKLTRIFAIYGKLVKLKVMRDSYTKKSRGFAFVTFENKEEAEEACEKLNHIYLNGREINVYMKRKTHELNKEANLFIKNLELSITSRELNEMTKDYGKIVSCYIKYKDEVNESLGYGYCQFEDLESAEKCKEALHETEVKGQEISVSTFVSKAKRGGGRGGGVSGGAGVGGSGGDQPQKNQNSRGFSDEWVKRRLHGNN